MQIAILVEQMRREGHEVLVSRPEVIYRKDAQGNLLEPIEKLFLEIPKEYMGPVLENLSGRKGEITNMTHHGEDPDKLKWLTQSDIWYMEEWAYFLGKLKSIKEGQATLLDHCLVAYGSTGGTINAHNRENLPAILAGGAGLGIKHQGHLTSQGDYLGNLWQTMFTALGVNVPENFQGGEADGIIKPLL